MIMLRASWSMRKGLHLPAAMAARMQGKWTSQDEAQLVELVKQKGRKWRDIGSVLNRLPEGCRDKYKEISLGGALNKGRWSKEEADKLRTAVHAYLAKRTVRSQHRLLCLGCQPAVAEVTVLPSAWH